MFFCGTASAEARFVNAAARSLLSGIGAGCRSSNETRLGKLLVVKWFHERCFSLLALQHDSTTEPWLALSNVIYAVGFTERGPWALLFWLKKGNLLRGSCSMFWFSVVLPLLETMIRCANGWEKVFCSGQNAHQATNRASSLLRLATCIAVRSSLLLSHVTTTRASFQVRWNQY